MSAVTDFVGDVVGGVGVRRWRRGDGVGDVLDSDLRQSSRYRCRPLLCRPSRVRGLAGPP